MIKAASGRPSASGMAVTLLQRDKPMAVAEFFVVTDTRPDEERWELIDGESILNATPAWDHQRVVRNLVASLTRL